jgi:hypothetical protein
MLKQVQHDGNESLKGPNIGVALQSRGTIRRTQALPTAQGYGNIVHWRIGCGVDP